MARPLTGDRQGQASNPRTLRDLERLDVREERRMVDALAVVLGTPEGRLFVGEWLHRHAGLFVTSFDHSGSIMCFKEGRRSAGLELLATTQEAHSELSDLMVAEQQQRARAVQRERDALTHPREEDSDGRQS